MIGDIFVDLEDNNPVYWYLIEKNLAILNLYENYSVPIGEYMLQDLFFCTDFFQEE